MRPLTGADVLAFYSSRCDLLVLTADGGFTHIDTDSIQSSSYDDDRATAYDYITTDDGTEVQVLLERSTIAEGEFFPDALDDDGALVPAVANEMADVINQDGILPGRIAKAAEAGRRWAEADKAADALALARAQAVAEVVAFCGGNQSAAARLLNLDQSRVNKILSKLTRKTERAGA